MSQTHDEQNESERPLPEDLPHDETPAVAGGGDTSEPEQGEGESNSY